jgi:hypothetical protein
MEELALLDTRDKAVIRGRQESKASKVQVVTVVILAKMVLSVAMALQGYLVILGPQAKAVLLAIRGILVRMD